LERGAGVQVINAIGLNIGATFWLLAQLDYFFAFPSGLGILADVVNTPCMMWYWSNIQNPKFLDCYADPENVASWRHINLPYNTVEQSLLVFDTQGMRHINAAYHLPR
jgi:hypothetical protein